MIILKPYQEKAIDNMLADTYELLANAKPRNRMILKAPTGAGKTVTMAGFLNKLNEELPDKLELQKREVAIVWIAPNQLHLQSHNSLKNYFAALRSLRPIQYEDITGDALQPGDILFLNWESINKKNNIYVKENEQGKNVFNYINQAKLNGVEILVVMDEEHLYVDAPKAKEVLQKIYAKIEIGVSATPKSNSDYQTNIRRSDVVKAEMIKEKIDLNPALEASTQADRPLNQFLLDMALEKRLQIKKAYEHLGITINPLLLIQLPNDSSLTETVGERQLIEEVEQFLDVKAITVKNNRLAVWLSGRKDNLAGIEAPDAFVEVLLFKQAIALGWDCPRAAVLLIFRELHNDTFTIQTVGRILRMPEQKHYPDPLLNIGYVFTNLSKKQIKVVQDDMDYIVQNRATRRPDYQDIHLQSAYANTRITRNRLNSRFKKALYQTTEEIWQFEKDLGSGSLFERNHTRLQQQMVIMDVHRIEIPIPRDIILTGETEIVSVNELERFAKTQDELNMLFRQFCRHHISPYAVVDSTPMLEMALKLLFEEYLGLNEYDAVKIMLFEGNQPVFVQLVEKAKEKYEKEEAARAKSAKRTLETYDWDVPVERVFNEHYTEVPVQQHAMIPFYEFNNSSNPEKEFVAFLESKKDHIEWWYKNGAQTKEHLGIPYTDYTNKESMFYPDFIIKTKAGRIAVFDTKTQGSDAANAHLKHEALINWVEVQKQQGKNVIGSLIIGKQRGDVISWRYCINKIENTKDLTGWEFFDPATLN